LTEIELVADHLVVPLPLHAAAHDAKCFPWFPIFHDETRNNGVKRPFAWRVNVRVTRIHRKKFTAILKHETQTKHYDPAAHAAIIALYERYHVALLASCAVLKRMDLLDSR